MRSDPVYVSLKIRGEVALISDSAVLLMCPWLTSTQMAIKQKYIDILSTTSNVESNL